MRVLIRKDMEKAHLTIASSYAVQTLYTREVLGAGQILRNAPVEGTKIGVRVGTQEYKVFAVLIEPRARASFVLDGRHFRGSLILMRQPDGRLQGINVLPVEDYLYGVLYHEVSHYWPMEALKAQAIASRTFALQQASQTRGKDYDLTADVLSQVYGGATSERRRTNRAIDQTRGQVLTFNGELLPAYFHATCGGRTEDAGHVWKVDLAPLKGVACSYCGASPHYRWELRLPTAELEKTLRLHDLDVGSIKEVGVEPWKESERIQNLLVRDGEKTWKVPAKDLRLWVGPSRLRSTLFAVSIEGRDAFFEGRGWGHGVGLCQWGALGLSREGVSAARILQYYYPGSQIETR